MNVSFLQSLGLKENNPGTSAGLKWLTDKSSDEIKSYSPVDGKLIASVAATSEKQFRQTIKTANEAFKVWRMMPAPKRGFV
jgi:aldehyde dehydrogenase (NAD+)